MCKKPVGFVVGGRIVGREIGPSERIIASGDEGCAVLETSRIILQFVFTESSWSRSNHGTTMRMNL